MSFAIKPKRVLSFVQKEQGTSKEMNQTEWTKVARKREETPKEKMMKYKLGSQAKRRKRADFCDSPGIITIDEFYCNNQENDVPITTPPLTTTTIQNDKFSELDNILYDSFMGNEKLKNKEIFSCDKVTISGENLETLGNCKNLSGEIIDYFIYNFNANQKKSNCYCFNTRFSRLANFASKEFDYKKTSKWHKDVEILSCEKVLVPIKLEFTYCLIIIDLKNRKFQKLGSSNLQNSSLLDFAVDNLKKYLVQVEKENEEGEGIKNWNPESWESSNIPDLHCQHYDCAVLICQYIKCIMENSLFVFTQDDVPRIRKDMALQIIKNSIVNQ